MKMMKASLLAAALSVCSMTAYAADASANAAPRAAETAARLAASNAPSGTAQPAPANDGPLTVTIKNGDKPPAKLVLPAGARMRITSDTMSGQTGQPGKTFSGKAQFIAKLASGARIRIDADELHIDSGAQPPQ